MSSFLKIKSDSQFWRMNCQMFSAGLSSGDLGGKGMRVMVCGTLSEPLRDCRRLQLLRGWSYDKENIGKIFT